jgi:hypothetical protein
VRKKDLPLIIVIGFVSLVFSLILSNLLFNSSAHKQLDSAKVTPITTEFSEPDKVYFNEQSINPTQKIQINENSNEQPFNQ